MIARAGSGWQTTLADLSLILFVVAVAAVNDTPVTANVADRAVVPAVAEPVALWRGQGDIARWLAEQPADPRLRLTIVAGFDQAAAAQQIAAAAGRPARVVLESDRSGAPFAALTFDLPAPAERNDR